MGVVIEVLAVSIPFLLHYTKFLVTHIDFRRPSNWALRAGSIYKAGSVKSGFKGFM